MRIGIVGVGRHGERYLKHLVAGDVAGASVTAFWRRDREKGATLSTATGARFIPLLEELLASTEIDALIAAIPAGEHARVATLAKKPLLLEKPIAPTVGQARRIIDHFHRANALLMIAQTLRFDPLVLELKRRTLSFGTLRGFTFEQRIEPRGLAWEDDANTSGGGVLLQTAIHTVDALRFITGDPPITVLSATSAQVEYRHNEDHAVITLRAKDALGTISVSKIGKARTFRLALYFDQGTLEGDLIDRTLTEVRGRDRRATKIPEQPTVVATANAFVKAVRGEQPNPITGEDACASLAIVEAAYQFVSVDRRKEHE